MIKTVYVKGLVVLAAFVTGAVVNGWRVESHYAEKEKVAAEVLKTVQDERDALSKLCDVRHFRANFWHMEARRHL